MLVATRFGDFAERLRIATALKEAVLNALYHGNLELTADQAREAREKMAAGDQLELVGQRRELSPYRDRKIRVEAKVGSDEARFSVRDQGPGFDTSAVPDLGDPGALEPESGRGLSLMRNFMDEVIYNDAGNEVTLVRRR
jgi:anti-sigma regulatory factor (Ser/Thr protein kinase)